MWHKFESHHDRFSRKGRGILVYDQSNINKVSCLILFTEVHHLSHGRWQNGSFQDEEKLRIQKLKIYICISLLTKRRKGNMFQKYDWSTIKDNFSNCQKVSQQFFFFLFLECHHMCILTEAHHLSQGRQWNGSSQDG